MYQITKIIFCLARETSKYFTYENFHRSYWELRNGRIIFFYPTLGKKHREKPLQQAGAVKHPGTARSATRMTPEHQLVTDLQINKNLLFEEIAAGTKARWHFWRWILHTHRAEQHQRERSVATIKTFPVPPLPRAWPATLTACRFFPRNKKYTQDKQTWQYFWWEGWTAIICWRNAWYAL